jgi:1,2-phenylacetyl-CoA epoxidase PaaB subunit
MWFEDDILVARIVGALEADDSRRILEMGEELYTRHGYILILMDAKRATGMSSEARKIQADRLKRFIRPSHSAIYHVNAVGRMMSTLMQRGIELLTGKTYPVSFHRDEADARAQLASQRVLLRGAKAPR